jgi:hypothetical protein
MARLPILVAILLAATSCIFSEQQRTLWLENDTQSTIVIFGTGRNHTLLPGEALDVGTTAEPGLDEFSGTIAGEPVTIVIDTGDIER